MLTLCDIISHFTRKCDKICEFKNLLSSPHLFRVCLTFLINVYNILCLSFLLHVKSFKAELFFPRHMSFLLQGFLETLFLKPNFDSIQWKLRNVNNEKVFLLIKSIFIKLRLFIADQQAFCAENSSHKSHCLCVWMSMEVKS